jgi:PTH1 family peptidyl-tRNA hydrolase
LRNPSPEYEGTRHNVGEEIVRAVAGPGARFKRAKRGIRAVVAETALEGGPAVLALPTTFMNESGQAVAPLVRYFDVTPDRIVLVHDDIDLPFGKLRFHFGRGTGGHNGVDSVVRSLGTAEVWRLKFGVGRPPGRMDPADFVLRRFTQAERSDVDLLVDAAADVVRSFAGEGDEAAIRRAGEAGGRLGMT